MKIGPSSLAFYWWGLRPDKWWWFMLTIFRKLLLAGVVGLQAHFSIYIPFAVFFILLVLLVLQVGA